MPAPPALTADEEDCAARLARELTANPDLVVSLGYCQLNGQLEEGVIVIDDFGTESGSVGTPPAQPPTPGQ